MAFSGSSRYTYHARHGHAVFPFETKMFSRLSAGAFRNATSTGATRSPNILHVARSRMVLCFFFDDFFGHSTHQLSHAQVRFASSKGSASSATEVHSGLTFIILL